MDSKQNLETVVEEVTVAQGQPVNGATSGNGGSMGSGGSGVGGSSVGDSGGSDVVFTDKPKKSNGMILGMILLALIAAGGIGFGVWAMMDGNSQKETLNSQISTLQEENNELQEKVAELESTIETYENSEASETGDFEAEVVEGVFYVKDSEGNVLAQSESLTVTELTACEYLAEDSTLKCTVVTPDGEGWFVFNTVENTLSSSFDTEQEQATTDEE